METTALITGASSGIGFELSKVFAKKGYNLVLVARNAEKLESISTEIQEQHNVRVKVMPKDLCSPSAPQALYDDLTVAGINIDVLVNNAGVGANGKFTDIDIKKQTDLIQLNITALTTLCGLFGRDMVKKGTGRILNVASTAAFQAGPYMSVYYASKAYVLLFSEGLKNELKGDGVSVTVLCPGATHTKFFERSDMVGTKLEKSPVIMHAAKVAEIGYAGMMKGKAIVIPGFVNKIMVFSVRFTPRSVISSITAYLNRK